MLMIENTKTDFFMHIIDDSQGEYLRIDAYL
jgi:hypothetical protein